MRNIQEKLLEKIYHLALKRNRTVLAVMGVITLVLAVPIASLKITSSHMDLVSRDNPEQKRYLEFLDKFGAADSIIVVLEGDYETLKASAEHFASEYKSQKKWINSIFYRIDTSFFVKRAPLFVSTADLQKGYDVISKKKEIVDEIAGYNNLMSILAGVRGAIRAPSLQMDVEIVPDVINGVNVFFEEWNIWITDLTHNRIKLFDKLFRPGTDIASVVKSDGYLFSRDFSMLFLFIQPASSNDSVEYLRPMMADIRSSSDRVFVKHPELRDRIKVAYTGMPVHTLTETETVFQDVKNAGTISIVLVALILLFGFGSWKKVVLCIIPLVSGMVITLGLVSLTVGRLNLISSSFLAVLFGIGIDFGIYLIRRTEEEIGNGLSLEDSLYKSVVVTGTGILTGGLTTGLAFLALVLSDFSGYSELGITAGIGVFVVMASTFLIMPSLLLIFRIPPRKYKPLKTLSHDYDIKRRKFALATVITAAVFMLVGLYGIHKNSFDFYVLNLLPKDVESTEYQLKMEEKSDFSTSFAALTGRDFDKMTGEIAALKKLPSISRIDSLNDMIPEDQAEKIRIINKFKSLFRNFYIPLKKVDKTGSDYVSILDELYELFENSQEQAFTAGHTAIVNEMDKLLASIDRLKDKLASDESGIALKRTEAFEKEIFSDIGKMVNQMHDWMSISPIFERSISREVINRFKSADGTYLAYIFPSGSIWDVDFLDKFVSEIKEINPEVTGFPVTHRVFVRQAARGVIYPFFYSLIVVLILLFLDFRKPVPVILAMIPLITGVVSSQAVLYFAGIRYNVANIAGLPLLLGLGVVYGVHIVHRWQENKNITAFAASQTTGRGVFFAAFTTISGLFSIVFAKHGGVSSFGIVLLLGISLCLISALFVLPSIIDLFFLKKGEKDE